LENARERFLISDKICYSMTAVLEIQGAQARLIMKDPLASGTVSIAGRSYPLAVDFSIGTAALLAENRPQRLDFIRMIRPAKYAATARLPSSRPCGGCFCESIGDGLCATEFHIEGLRQTPARQLKRLNLARKFAITPLRMFRPLLDPAQSIA
jgi:hypothetical protein